MSDESSVPPVKQKLSLEDLAALQQTAKRFSDGIQQWSVENKDRIDAAMRSFNQGMASLGAVIVAANEKWTKFVEDIAPTIKAAVETYQARIATYPNLSSKIEVLAKNGWFVCLPMLDFHELDRLAAAELDDEALCAYVEDLYERHFDEFVENVCAEFPERATIVRQAAQAHVDGNYSLTVPVFFAQADGVCSQRLQKYIFISGRGNSENIKPVAEAKVEELLGKDGLFEMLDLVMWLPFKDKQPVALTKGTRATIGYTGLNRNDVLHGDSLDYGTKTNSLKAFSMLCHVAALLAADKIAASEVDS